MCKLVPSLLSSDQRDYCLILDTSPDLHMTEICCVDRQEVRKQFFYVLLSFLWRRSGRTFSKMSSIYADLFWLDDFGNPVCVFVAYDFKVWDRRRFNGTTCLWLTDLQHRRLWYHMKSSKRPLKRPFFIYLFLFAILAGFEVNDEVWGFSWI